MLAQDVMVRQVHTVAPDMTVTELADFLREKAISGAPVVDQRGDLLGVVSTTDLLLHAPWDGETYRTERNLYQSEGFWIDLDLLKKRLRSTDHSLRVRDIMTATCYHVDETTPLHTVIYLMDLKSVHRIIVTREQRRVVGIITSMDLVRYLGTLVQPPSPTFRTPSCE
ncbi:MAG: CBS domain-containing protein [Armatimonadetes bacterium]|nr:CBS domain-containing protein [Armatimonadota bacterium]